MPFVSCNTYNTSQAAQDAAIAALQAGGGSTPTSVASAVNAMTPAQLAAMCAKLNCQPTAAALTATLLALSGASVAGNVLTIVGGAPVWQTPVAVPTSTDTAAGVSRSATVAETAAGTANDGVHVSPLDLLGAVGTAGALSSALAINPSQYGTFAGVGAPTAAPTAANPATEVTNTNGEVFRWNGTGWYLSGNGYFESQPGYTATPTAGTVLHFSHTVLRNSVITVSGGDLCVTSGNSQNIVHLITKNGANIAIQNVLSASDINHASMSVDVLASAGDVLTYQVDYVGAAPNVAILFPFNVRYTK